uniref:Uncharacterized protein n=1 Tax=Globodera rostochiensis TaxID=31243 RepID=A0A914HKW7_GLORO
MGNSRFFFQLCLLLPCFIISTAQSGNQDHTEEESTKIRRLATECRISEPLYRELRLLSSEGNQEEHWRNCSVPGCFFVYPPKDSQNFMPSRMLTRQTKGDILGGALQGCRSDIPFMLQRATFSKDVKLLKLLRYLRACFVFDTERIRNGSLYTKQCQPEASTHKVVETPQLSKRNWVEQNAFFTDNQCFYPFHREKIFYVSFGQHSEGRVICCSDGKLDPTDQFQRNCRTIAEHIYGANRDGGWRKGKDAE